MSENTEAPVLTKEFIQEKLATDDRWLYRGLIALYNRQTRDEQDAEITRHSNGQGFSSCDAEILTSFAKQLITRGFLSEKQRSVTRKCLKKYAGQLLKVAKEKAA